MAQKGVNTIIVETKNNILESVNNGLKQGLPIAILQLTLSEIMAQVNATLNDTLKSEHDDYQKQVQIENEQVEYVQENNE